MSHMTMLGSCPTHRFPSAVPSPSRPWRAVLGHLARSRRSAVHEPSRGAGNRTGPGPGDARRPGMRSAPPRRADALVRPPRDGPARPGPHCPALHDDQPAVAGEVSTFAARASADSARPSGPPRAAAWRGGGGRSRGVRVGVRPRCPWRHGAVAVTSSCRRGLRRLGRAPESFGSDEMDRCERLGGGRAGCVTEQPECLVHGLERSGQVPCLAGAGTVVGEHHGEFGTGGRATGHRRAQQVHGLRAPVHRLEAAPDGRKALGVEVQGEGEGRVVEPRDGTAVVFDGRLQRVDGAFGGTRRLDARPLPARALLSARNARARSAAAVASSTAPTSATRRRRPSVAQPSRPSASPAVVDRRLGAPDDARRLRGREEDPREQERARRACARWSCAVRPERRHRRPRRRR